MGICRTEKRGKASPCVYFYTTSHVIRVDMRNHNSQSEGMETDMFILLESRSRAAIPMVLNRKLLCLRCPHGWFCHRQVNIHHVSVEIFASSVAGLEIVSCYLPLLRRMFPTILHSHLPGRGD